MAYKYKIPPAKNQQPGNSSRINFGKVDEWVICATCGKSFHRTHNATIYCSRECRGARLTAQDRLNVNIFIAVCKRYGLNPGGVFVRLIGNSRGWYEWGRFIDKPNGTPLGKARKDRYLMMLQKFIADLQAGWYDLVPNRLVPKRRTAPGERYCPMNLSHCRGGFLVGDCTRPNCRMTAK